MLSASVVELIDVVGRLEIAVDADDLVAVCRVRELLLAKSRAPLPTARESARGTRCRRPRGDVGWLHYVAGTAIFLSFVHLATW